MQPIPRPTAFRRPAADSAEAIADAIEAIYESILTPGGRRTLMERTARLLGANSGAVHIASVHTNRITEQLPYLGEYSESDWERLSSEYNRDYFPADMRVARMATRLRNGVFRDTDIVTGDEIRRSALYNDLLLPWNRTNQILYLRIVDGLKIITNLNAGVGRPRFDDNEVEVAGLLFRHIHRAALMHLKMGELDARLHAAANAMEALPFGIILLRADARILFSNRAADALIRRGDGIAANGCRLTLCDRSSRAALDQALDGISRVRDGKPPAMSRQVIRVPRSDGKPPYALHVVPVPASMKVLASFYALAMVCVFDLASGAGNDVHQVARAFGLTAAEARLATVIAAGHSLSEAAEKFELSQATVRTQLKAIFAKTDTRRQGELVSLLLRSR